jgi:hypothetical protein
MRKISPQKNLIYIIKEIFSNFFVRKMENFVPEKIYIGGEYFFYHFCNVPSQSDDYIHNFHTQYVDFGYIYILPSRKIFVENNLYYLATCWNLS